MTGTRMAMKARKRALTCIAQGSGILILCAMRYLIYLGSRKGKVASTLISKTT
jgi:hypothetical protein